MSKCAHLPAPPHPAPRAKGGEECLATGGRWLHLSPGRHVTKRFHASTHPVMQSFEPGETWGWSNLESKELGPFPALR